MKSRKMRLQSRVAVGLLCFVLLPTAAIGMQKAPKTVVIQTPALSPEDSIKAKVEARRKQVEADRKTVAFIVDHIENTYIFGRRGIDSAEWDKRVKMLYDKVDSADSWSQYYYALRYVGQLIEDAHFGFPDNGLYNRHRLFQKTDTLLPLRIKSWTDGRVYIVRDYTSTLPENAQIISVNGNSAVEMALMNRAIFPGEDRYAMALMNEGVEAEPRYWSNFANFLFMESINAPYRVRYIDPATSKLDSVVLNGMEREQIRKIYKRSGDERQVAHENGGGFYGKFMEYKNLGNGIGVLTIDSFWGKDLLELMICGTDNRYVNRLKNKMRLIARDKIEHLIIDISGNGGGMEANMLKTLNYFTDKPIDVNGTYLVTDNNRAIAKTVMTSSNPKLFGYAKDDMKRLSVAVDSVKSGTLFSTDSVLDFTYRPDAVLKHRYTGKVYLITGARTFSAAQVFAQNFKTLAIGITAGQPCGGYSSTSGGNGQYVRIPGVSWTFMPPYSKLGRKDQPVSFDYDKVDIPFEITFDQWLRGENSTLQQLIELIRKNNPI